MEINLKRKLVKAYFYLDKGLDILNKFKYQGAGIFALYYTLQLNNPLLILAMFVVSVPILILLGWLWIKRVARSLEKMSVDKGTYYSIYGYSLQEDIALSLRKLAKRPRTKRDLNKLKPSEIK